MTGKHSSHNIIGAMKEAEVMKKLTKAFLILVTIFAMLFAISGCGEQSSTAATTAADSAPEATSTTTGTSPAPGGTLHLTIVSHNEEPSAKRPDYLNDRAYYLQNRALLVQLVETISKRGAAYNFQSDWNFLQAVAKYDQGDVTSDTSGKNIVKWMVEDRGVEVDPHAHESRYNYADVADLIQQLGVTPTNTVGGFLFSPPDNPQGWEQHQRGLAGAVFPEYFWHANILWGAATGLHQGVDDHSSGVWRPRDRNSFYTDDPNQALNYIGGCTRDYDGATALESAIQKKTVPQNGFYTASIMLIQDRLTEQSIQQLGDFIDSTAPKVENGSVQWLHLTQVAEEWRTEYQAQAFVFNCDGLPVS